MSVTSTDQVQDPAATSEQDAAVEATMAEAFAEEDLSIPEDVPSADDPSSRATHAISRVLVSPSTSSQPY